MASSDKNYDFIIKTIASKVSNLNENDIILFFKSFLTPSEILDFCDRYLIVESLIKGKTHREIASDLKVSLTKVASGSKELKFKHGKKFFKKFIEL